MRTADSREIPAHVISDPGVVQETLNSAYSANGNILVPQLLPAKVHDVFLSYTIYCSFHVFGAHPPSSRDDLTTNVFGDSGGAVEGEQNGCFELSFGTLHFCSRDTLR